MHYVLSLSEEVNREFFGEFLFSRMDNETLILFPSLSILMSYVIQNLSLCNGKLNNINSWIQDFWYACSAAVVWDSPCLWDLGWERLCKHFEGFDEIDFEI